MESHLIYPLAIIVGAVPGALCRFLITECFRYLFGQKFPYGTFLVNLTGCFLGGCFLALASSIEAFPKVLELMIRIGFIGSYTTFSTYGWETFVLWRAKNLELAIFYAMTSALTGLGTFYLGINLTQLLLK